MATAIPGNPFTFHTLFLDGDGDPVAVTGATAKVFYFDADGDEVVLTTSSMSAVSGDTGRYAYTYDVPTSLDPGLTIYGLMYGVDPGTSDVIRVQVEVALVADSTGRMVALFVE